MDASGSFQASDCLHLTKSLASLPAATFARQCVRNVRKVLLPLHVCDISRMSRPAFSVQVGTSAVRKGRESGLSYSKEHLCNPQADIVCADDEAWPNTARLGLDRSPDMITAWSLPTPRMSPTCCEEVSDARAKGTRSGYLQARRSPVPGTCIQS